MEQATTAFQLSEHADKVLLHLPGTIDVFVAADLSTTAKQLAAIGKDVHVTCARTEGLDTSAVQILLALQAALRTKGKQLVLLDVSPGVEQWIAFGGVASLLLTPPKKERSSCPERTI